MTTRIIHTERDRQSLIALIAGRALPFHVAISKKEKRSVEQNRLQRLWLNEAAEQLEEYTAEEYRGYCKLIFGVPILRADDEEFCRVYDLVIRPLPYEKKLLAMQVPLDLPVTSMMTTKQKTTYLDAMWHHFQGLGVKLTEPMR